MDKGEKEIVEAYLDCLNPTQITIRTGKPMSEVQRVLKTFYDSCLQTYQRLVSRGGSKAGAAEVHGLNRWYFEDFVAKHDLDMVDADEGLRILQNERRKIVAKG